MPNGIFAASNGSTVTINSTADIVTTGGSAPGIQGSGQNALLTITSSGNIATSGNNAFGIAAGARLRRRDCQLDRQYRDHGHVLRRHQHRHHRRLRHLDGAITITSSGNIATSGSSAIGINAASVYGPIDITSSAISRCLALLAIGINAQTEGAVTITSAGDIATGPNSSVAIMGVIPVR